MIKKLLRRRIEAFEKRWGYNCTYLRTVTEVSPDAMLKLVLLQPAMSHRKSAPRNAWSAAEVTATMAADCGSCLELAKKTAPARGMSDESLQHLLAGNVDLMEDDVFIGHSFAQAVIERDEEELPRLRAEIVRRWGPQALVSLSMITAIAGFYPALKTGIGREPPSDAR